MSFDVDFSGSPVMSISRTPGTVAAYQTVWPGQFAPRRYFALSISIEPEEQPRLPSDPHIYTNPAGTALTIISYQHAVREDNQQVINWTIRNDSNYQITGNAEVNPITFTVNAISIPS